MAKEETTPIFDAKGMIEKHTNSKTKIKYGERKKVEIVADTKYYKKGQIIQPHLIVADRLIEQKIAVAKKVE